MTAIDATSVIAWMLSSWSISSVCVATSVCSSVCALVRSSVCDPRKRRLVFGDEFLVGGARRQPGRSGDRLRVGPVVVRHEPDGRGEIVGGVGECRQVEVARSQFDPHDLGEERHVGFGRHALWVVGAFHRRQRAPIDDQRSGQTGHTGGTDTGDEAPPRQRGVGSGLSDFEIHGGWVLSGHATAAFQPGRRRSDSRARRAVNTGFVRS